MNDDETQPEPADDNAGVDDVRPGANDWLDPSSSLHRHRKRPVEPRGPLDRLRSRWRRWRRHRRKVAKNAPWYRPRNISLGLLGLVVVLILAVVVTALIKIHGIRRAPLLPVAAATGSLGTNLVVFGSAGDSASLDLDAQTLMVQFIHIGADYRTGQVIDFPRDLVIGEGPAAHTILDLYKTQGVVGVVGALQSAMKVTVNHVFQTSFAGYAAVSDALGGVTIPTVAGSQHFSGPQASAYVLGDAGQTSIETGHRYQFWSKALLESTLKPSVVVNPFKAWSVFTSTANNIVVDDTLDDSGLIKLVWHLRSLQPARMHFFTAPNKGYATVHGDRVLRSSPIDFDRLSTAIRTDNLATIGLFQ